MGNGEWAMGKGKRNRNGNGNANGNGNGITTVCQIVMVITRPTRQLVTCSLCTVPE